MDATSIFDPAHWNWVLIGIWIGVGVSLFMYSFLYKDNPLFKFAEHLFVGVSAGYGLCVTWYLTLWPRLVRPLFRLVLSWGDWSLGKLVPDRFQESSIRVVALTVQDGGLVPARSIERTAVEVGIQRQTGLNRRVAHRNGDGVV